MSYFCLLNRSDEAIQFSSEHVSVAARPWRDVNGRLDCRVCILFGCGTGRFDRPEETHCGCGGIGRRAGFRSQWGQPRGGSTPLSRISLSGRHLRTNSNRPRQPTIEEPERFACHGSANLSAAAKRDSLMPWLSLRDPIEAVPYEFRETTCSDVSQLVSFGEHRRSAGGKKNTHRQDGDAPP